MAFGCKRPALIIEFKGDTLNVCHVPSLSHEKPEIAETSWNAKSPGTAAEYVRAKFMNRIDDILVVALLPCSLVSMRSGYWPSHDQTELKKMILLQMTRQTPHHREEMIIDSAQVRKYPDGRSLVASIMVTLAVLKPYLNFFKCLGVDPDWVTMNPMKYAASFPDMTGLVSADDNGASSLICLDQGHILLTEEVKDEVQSTADTFIDRCRELFPDIHLGLAVKKQLPHDWPFKLRDHYFLFNAPLNMVPNELRSKKQAEHFRCQSYHAAWLLLATAFLFVLPFFVELARNFIELDILKNEIRVNKSRVETIDKKRADIEKFRTLWEKRVLISEALSLLSRELPAQVIVDNFEYSSESGWKLEGRSPGVGEAEEAMHVLSKISDKSDAQCRLVNVEKRSSEEGEVAYFKGLCS